MSVNLFFFRALLW